MLRKIVFAIYSCLENLLYRQYRIAPFSSAPKGSRSDYLELHTIACEKSYPEVDVIEDQLGFSIDKTWLEDLALHTQVVKKESILNYQHGRLLYTLLRNYIATNQLDYVTVLETGTARGFSALCMAKALYDAEMPGKIITIDVLPHNTPFYWNCIDDHEGPKSRNDLLAPWSQLLKYIVFIEGDTVEMMRKVGLDRVNFAFLDAQHLRENVHSEYQSIKKSQQKGDMIFFDDYTPELFPGVVLAVDEILNTESLEFKKISLSDERGYVYAYHSD